MLNPCLHVIDAASRGFPQQPAQISGEAANLTLTVPEPQFSCEVCHNAPNVPQLAPGQARTHQNICGQLLPWEASPHTATHRGYEAAPTVPVNCTNCTNKLHRTLHSKHSVRRPHKAAPLPKFSLVVTQFAASARFLMGWFSKGISVFGRLLLRAQPAAPTTITKPTHTH